MSASQVKVDFAPCVPGALSGGLVRTRFFDGMFLTQADLESHQAYLRAKRRLTNRALGRGVVWGLRLTWDPRTRRFRLGPGYGLDCCGNDLVVECPYEVDERSLMDLSSPIFESLPGGQSLPNRRCPHPAAAGEVSKACIVLEYVECPQDPRPVHRDACTTNVTQCELSRVRETTRLLVVPCPAPPPPSPLDDLCSDLETLRKSVEGTTVESVLFPMPEPAPPPGTELPLTLQVRTANAELTIRLDRDPMVVTRKTIAIDTDDPTVAFEVQPVGGWALYSGRAGLQEDDETEEPLAKIDPPLDLRLGWSQSLETETRFIFQVSVGFGSLFDDASRRSGGFTISGNLQADGVTLNIDVSPVGVEDQPLDPPPPAPCWELLEGVIFSGDPLCTAKGVLLAAVYAWLKSLIDAEDTTDRWTGPRLLAAWTYLVAWRLLFGANAAGTQRAELTKLLAALFKKWCSGMHYPGPRCLDDVHGVYLGCVDLAPNGAIVRFDPWEHRRHVITGPLLAHWGGQFGLAPIDVIAGRFARAICCVAGHSAPNAPEPLPALKDLLYVTADDSTSPAHLGLAAAVTGSGSTFFYGNAIDLDKYFEKADLVEGRPATLSWPNFVVRLVESFAAGEQPNERTRDVFTLAGTKLHLLVPAGDRPSAVPKSPTPAAKKVEAEAEALTAVMTPLARKPAAEFVAELARAVQVDALNVAIPEVDFQPLVRAMSTAGAETAGNVLDIGAEDLLARLSRPAAIVGPQRRQRTGPAAVARTQDDVAKDVDAVVTSAEKLLSQTANVLVKFAGKGADKRFVRSTLNNTDLQEVLVKTVDATTLDPKIVAKVAARVATR